MKAVKISERREEEVGRGRREEGEREGKGGGRRREGGKKGRRKRERGKERKEEVYVNDSFVCDTLTGMLFGLG